MVQQIALARISPSAPHTNVIGKSALSWDAFFEHLFPELPIFPPPLPPPTLLASDADSMLDDLIEIIGREDAAPDVVAVDAVLAPTAVTSTGAAVALPVHHSCTRELPDLSYAQPQLPDVDVYLQSFFEAPPPRGFELHEHEDERAALLQDGTLLVPVSAAQPANLPIPIYDERPVSSAVPITVQLSHISPQPQVGLPTSLPTTTLGSSAHSTDPSNMNECDEVAASSLFTSNAADEEAGSEDERRRRNNASSRRSRSKRKSRERHMFEELRAAERRNAELRAQIARARSFQETMQEGLVRCIKEGNHKR